MSTSLGPLVRLEGITIQQLPSGGKPAGTDLTALELQSFITNIITEAVPFIDGVAPKAGGQPSWKKKGSGKRFSSSEALVYSYERTVPGQELDKIAGMSQFSADRKDETWFCRRSTHRNAAEKGTASWEEFVHSFKEHHHESEDAFTPAVIGAREAMTWDTHGIEVEAHGERWMSISLKVVEMKHRIDPKPLKNRTFPVLQLSTSLADKQEFIVVSIPVTDFGKAPQAEYARDKSLVVASYSSIERIRILPESGEIEWIMATASNAGGVLPQWLQNLAVPGKVAHDVDMFLAWIPSQRKGKAKAKPVPITKPKPVTRSSTFDKSLPLAPDKSLPAAPVQSETASVVTAPPPPISKEPEAEPAARPPMTREESSNKLLPAAPIQ